jgi:hypothetical protein
MSHYVFFYILLSLNTGLPINFANKYTKFCLFWKHSLQSESSSLLSRRSTGTDKVSKRLRIPYSRASHIPSKHHYHLSSTRLFWQHDSLSMASNLLPRNTVFHQLERGSKPPPFLSFVLYGCVEIPGSQYFVVLGDKSFLSDCCRHSHTI